MAIQSETPSWNEIFSYTIAYDDYAVVFFIQIHNL